MPNSKSKREDVSLDERPESIYDISEDDLNTEWAKRAAERALSEYDSE